MKNWLNQNIEEGSIVYRGARDGNSSSFKIGRVLFVNEDKEAVRVEWVAEHRNWFHSDLSPSDYEDLLMVKRPWCSGKKSTGTCSINTVVLVDIDIEEIERNLDEWDRLGASL